MKFIHLADLHLGKIIYQNNLLDIQIDLLNHDFFVFKNIDEDCVSVLYKRKDGKFGIINVK